MLNRKILLEKQILNSLKLINEQDDEDYYVIDAKDYEEMLKLAGYHHSVTKIKKFKGKPLWIKGNVDLRYKPIESLGNVLFIEGNLDVSNSKIKSLDGVKVGGYIWNSNTPLRRKLDMEEINEKKSRMSYERENNVRQESNPQLDEIDRKAIALYKFLVENGDVKEVSEDDRERIIEIKAEIEELNKRADETEDTKEYSKLLDKISDLESELEDIEPEFDVYDLYNRSYTHYGLDTFEILNYDDRDKEYSVGTAEQMEAAAYEYADNYIDEVGLNNFSESFIENNLDDDSFEEYVRDFYEDDIRENPDMYFNEEDFELTEEQKSKIEELEKYIEQLDTYISEKTEERDNLDNEIEDPQEYEDEWDKIQELIDKAESNKEIAESELEDITPDTDNPTEDMIETALKNRIDDAMYDKVSWLKDYGLNITDFVDRKSLISDLVDSDGWGIMNGYDGRYEEVRVNDEYYFVMRLN